MDSYLDNYIGEWDDECDHRLSITKVDSKTAFVSFFVKNQAISRPWFEDKLSTKMKARYEYDEGGLFVELWDSGKEFSLHLNFEPGYELDKQNRDSLSVALSRLEKDDFLDKYYCLFGPLKHYVRMTTPGRSAKIAAMRFAGEGVYSTRRRTRAWSGLAMSGLLW